MSFLQLTSPRALSAIVIGIDLAFIRYYGEPF